MAGPVIGSRLSVANTSVNSANKSEQILSISDLLGLIGNAGVVGCSSCIDATCLGHSPGRNPRATDERHDNKASSRSLYA